MIRPEYAARLQNLEQLYGELEQPGFNDAQVNAEGFAPDYGAMIERSETPRQPNMVDNVVGAVGEAVLPFVADETSATGMAARGNLSGAVAKNLDDAGNYASVGALDAYNTGKTPGEYFGDTARAIPAGAALPYKGLMPAGMAAAAEVDAEGNPYAANLAGVASTLGAGRALQGATKLPKVVQAVLGAAGLTWADAVHNTAGGQTADSVKISESAVATADDDKILQTQRILKDAGLYDGALDGKYGSGTRNAIRAYNTKIDQLVADRKRTEALANSPQARAEAERIRMEAERKAADAEAERKLKLDREREAREAREREQAKRDKAQRDAAFERRRKALQATRERVEKANRGGDVGPYAKIAAYGLGGFAGASVPILRNVLRAREKARIGDAIRGAGEVARRRQGEFAKGAKAGLPRVPSRAKDGRGDLEIASREGTAKTLFGATGTKYDPTGKTDNDLFKFDEVGPISRLTGTGFFTKNDEAILAGSYGMYEFSNYRYEAAKAEYEAALKTARETGDPSDFRRAHDLEKSMNAMEAIKNFETAVPLGYMATTKMVSPMNKFPVDRRSDIRAGRVKPGDSSRNVSALMGEAELARETRRRLQQSRQGSAGANQPQGSARIPQSNAGPTGPAGSTTGPGPQGPQGGQNVTSSNTRYGNATDRPVARDLIANAVSKAKSGKLPSVNDVTAELNKNRANLGKAPLSNKQVGERMLAFSDWIASTTKKLGRRPTANEIMGMPDSFRGRPLPTLAGPLLAGTAATAAITSSSSDASASDIRPPPGISVSQPTFDPASGRYRGPDGRFTAGE